MNLPNLVTCFRIVAAFIFLYFSALEKWDLAFPIFCAAAFTDLVDGALARLLHQRTKLGAFLDPTADKLLMLFSFVTLTVSHYIPLFLTFLVVARDLFIAFGLNTLLKKKIPVVYRPTYLSKVTTFFQILTVTIALLRTQHISLWIDFQQSTPWNILFDHFQIIILITTFFTLVTTFQYWRIGRRLLHDSPH